MSGASEAVKGRCPICGKPMAQKYRPFCSARCADVDLNRWLGGLYAVPAQEEPDPEDGPGSDGKKMGPAD